MEIVSNQMVFNDEGVLVGFEGECINSTNKNMSHRSYVNRQRTRDNVILIGDNLGDIRMSDGVAFQNQIAIGLLNDKCVIMENLINRVQERMDAYKETFDVVICNDSDLKFVCDVVKYIVEEDDFPCLKEEEDEGEEYIVVPPSLGYNCLLKHKHVKRSDLRLSVHDISGDIHCKKRLPHISIVQ